MRPIKKVAIFFNCWPLLICPSPSLPESAPVIIQLTPRTRNTNTETKATSSWYIREIEGRRNIQYKQKQKEIRGHYAQLRR